MKKEAKSSQSSDPELWRACAGRTVRVPAADSTVFYFPQGHAENANCSADLAASLGLPPLVLCRVAAVKLSADLDSDEVFARISLVPLPYAAADADDDGVIGGGGDGDDSEGSSQGSGKSGAAAASFAKVLTQSDANNGGGFSVPRHCADTIFPPLNYAADPPVQDLFARDIHGEVWKFRHIYRGTPRRHLLTSGWSVFVNKKRLVARDSIVFLRAGLGEICVGIRRARRGADATNYGGVFPCRGGNAGQPEEGRARAEGFMEAVTLAASGKAFDVVYYPRDGVAEFCVKASAVKAAMGEHWCAGTRVKMEVEDEAASRVKQCSGTVTSVQAYDPTRWPNSPWRLLQVAWDDEPDKLQNVQRVSPWMTEVSEGSNFPSFPFPSYAPPRKKLRLTQYPEFTLDGQFRMPPSILGNTLGANDPLGYLPNSTPAGIQGARHLFGVSLSDLHFNNQLQSGAIFRSNIQQLNHHSSISNGIVTGQTQGNGSLSCLLAVEESSPNSEKSESGKKRTLYLFGQQIVLEQQLSSLSSSNDVVSRDFSGKSPADENAEIEKSASNGMGAILQPREFGQDTGHCKVFKESEDVGWTLDLSVIGSYEELYRSLSNMFQIERSVMMTRVLYHDATGAPKRTGNEPFSDFMKTAKRLTILADPGSKHNI